MLEKVFNFFLKLDTLLCGKSFQIPFESMMVKTIGLSYIPDKIKKSLESKPMLAPILHYEKNN